MTARMRWVVVWALLVACSGLAALPALAGGAGPPTSRKNHRTALRDAAGLLRAVRLPPQAMSSAPPAGNRHHLGRSPAGMSGDFAHRTDWWTAGQSPGSVLSYVRSHAPTGGRLDMSGKGEQCAPHHFPPTHCQTTMQFLGFAFRPLPPALGTRWLLVAVTRLNDGSSLIRVDAEVQWIVPRAPGEKVPSGVSLIRVVRAVPGRRPSVSRRAASPRRIHQIVTLIDGLPIVQPGVTSCPEERASSPIVTFSFIGRGRTLAQARVRADVAPYSTGCDAMAFWINGRARTPLLRARHFLRAVGRLLGVRLTAPYGY